MSEALHTCAKCQRTNFTARGLKTHHCYSAPHIPDAPSMRDPATLKLHPLLSRITMMRDLVTGLRSKRVKKSEHVAIADELEADLAAFEESLDEHGIRDALKITKAGLIADGRHRWQWAMRRGVKRVPCLVVGDDQARGIIESMMIARRQLTKGMKAYAAVLLHPEVAEATKGAGMKKRSDSIGTLTRSDLALKYGVSPDLIDQACKLYSAFEASKTLRDKHEHLVWAGFGLGAIFAGLHGAERTDVSVKPDERVNGIFRRLNQFSGSLCDDWDLFETPDQREVIADAVTNFLARLPESLRKAALTKLPTWNATPELGGTSPQPAKALAASAAN